MGQARETLLVSTQYRQKHKRSGRVTQKGEIERRKDWRWRKTQEVIKQGSRSWPRVINSSLCFRWPLAGRGVLHHDRRFTPHVASTTSLKACARREMLYLAETSVLFVHWTQHCPLESIQNTAALPSPSTSTFLPLPDISVSFSPSLSYMYVSYPPFLAHQHCHSE